LKVTVVGQGYVGLVTAACAAEWGHDVIGVEQAPARRDMLLDGRVPFHEPGLSEIVAEHLADGRLRFSASGSEAVAASDITFVAVGTVDPEGQWETRTMSACLAEVVPHIPDGGVIVVRSTCPPPFVTTLAERVDAIRAAAGRVPIAVMLNPEFTKEGTAVQDFLVPDRVVIGIASDPDGHGEAKLREFYAQVEAPFLVLAAMDAILAKLGSNLFLATKISFANEMAAICDLYGAQIERVVEGMAHDARIGGSFLRAGVGFGGSCLPHQVTMTVRDSETLGISTPLFAAVEEVNDRQRRAFVDRIIAATAGAPKPRVALLGLTFKPGTDDMREAPSLEIARMLIEAGIRVTAYDPMEAARARAAQIIPALVVVDRASKAIMNSDAIGIVTEWPEFGKLPWAAIAKAVRRPIIVDGRNCLDPVAMALAGFDYIGFGRSARSVPVEEAGREEAGAASVVRERTLPTRQGYPVERLVHRGAESRVSEA
jgi:UDPglucose 6-dehydrogenase